MPTKTALNTTRVEPSEKSMIDEAASILKIDRAVFIQSAAVKEAKAVIEQHQDFNLNAAVFEDFENTLNSEPVRNSGVADLLSRKSPWGSEEFFLEKR